MDPDRGNSRTQKPQLVAGASRRTGGGSEPEDLKDQAVQVLDEARMVLPGIQALFGFQLIAIFSERFETLLTALERQMHLGAIMLVAVAIALVMTPAAYHRQKVGRRITPQFITLSSRLIAAAMIPLMLALVLDVYLVGRVVLGSEALSGVLGAALLILFITLLFILPRLRHART